MRWEVPVIVAVVLSANLTTVVPCFAQSATTGGLTAPVTVAPSIKNAPVPKAAGSGAETSQPPAVSIKVTGVRFSGDQIRTQIAFDINGPIKPNVFVLGEPTRVIVDVPDLQFKFTAADVPAAHGLISAWRYGLFAARKSRIVLDASVPIKVDRSQVIAKPGGHSWQFVLDIVATDKVTFDAILKLQPRAARPPLKSAASDDLPAASGKLNSKPVIVVSAKLHLLFLP